MHPIRCNRTLRTLALSAVGIIAAILLIATTQRHVPAPATQVTVPNAEAPAPDAVPSHVDEGSSPDALAEFRAEMDRVRQETAKMKAELAAIDKRNHESLMEVVARARRSEEETGGRIFVQGPPTSTHTPQGEVIWLELPHSKGRLVRRVPTKHFLNWERAQSPLRHDKDGHSRAAEIIGGPGKKAWPFPDEPQPMN